MTDFPNRNQIKKGINVSVELKKDQGTGKLTEGIVKEILTSGNSHPYGIKVELENGKTGRVKKLFTETSTVNSSITSFDIFKIVGKHSNKEDIQEILSDFNLPFSKNKDELLNLIFQNKTILKKAAKEMISELYKDELVKVCEKCNFNLKGNADELRERIMNGLFSIHETNSWSQIESKTRIKSDISIPKDEDTWNEFKSTYQLDLNRLEKGDGKKTLNKAVEKEIPVTISAMANKEGGILFIGVDDDGKILGLENDYELLKNLNDDKFLRTIWQIIKNFIKNITYVSKLDISLIDIESKKICIIKIPPADEPIFVHDNNIQESYVRMGSRSEKFTPSEFLKHCKTRFEA